ncbi:MAG: hypothetical protein ABJJ37_05790 [Roseibium sp.]
MLKYQIDKFALNAAVSALIEQTNHLGGIEFRYMNSVEGLEAGRASLSEEEVGEHFRKSLDTLPPNRFFWIGAFIDGVLIGMVAARCDETSGQLQEFVKAYWERTYEGEQGAFVKLQSGSPAAAVPYSGRLAYIGEGLVREDFRSKTLSYVLVRLALLFVFDEWRPEIAYGWMREHHAYRGLFLRWGFNRCETSAFEWLVRPSKTDWHNLAFLTCDQTGFEKLIVNPVPKALFPEKRSN